MSTPYPEAERIAITNAMHAHRDAHGTTYVELSEKFGLGRETVTDWLKLAGLYTPTYAKYHRWTPQEDHLLALDVTTGATGQEITETIPGVGYLSALNRKHWLRRHKRIR